MLSMLGFRTMKSLLKSLVFLTLFVSMGAFAGKGSSPWNKGQVEKIEKINEPSFCFAVMGDIHWHINDVFLNIYKMIESDPEVKFSVADGDVVSDGKEGEYKGLLNTVKKFKTPIVMAIGNHDVLNGGQARFEKYFGPTYYRFDVGDTAFFVLDSSSYEGKSFTDEEKTWLEGELAKTQDKKYRLVFFHVPLFEARAFPFDPAKKPKRVSMQKVAASYGIRNRDLAFELMNLFKKYNVSYIFTAHNHGYYQGYWGGVPFIISGGAGGKLKDRDSEHEFFNYVKACTGGDKLTTEVIRLQ